MTTESTRRVAGGGPSSGADAVDATFDVLGSARRRRVLSALAGRPERVALSDLADDVAARESTRASEHVRATLHHVHLPKLDDVGLVAYDADDRVVARTDALRRVARTLSREG